MRDYKNVTVPRKYRANTKRLTVTRVETTRIARGYGGSSPQGVKSTALKFLVILVIAAGSWLGWQAYRTMTHAEMFQISGVDVKGVQQLNEEDLKKIVGAFKGQNIFRVDLEAAVRRAKANPWVRTVSINRRLPNRISMSMTERVPYALLDTGKGRFLMDNEGVVIDRLAKEGAGTWPLPVIVAKDYRAQAGEQVASEGISEALMLLSVIAAQGGWQLHEVAVKASTPESLSIVYADREFKLGSAHYAEKLRRLAEVMADVKQRGIEIAYVDLRPDRQVAVMAKKYQDGKKIRR